MTVYTHPRPPRKRVTFTPKRLQITPEKKAKKANAEYKATVALSLSFAPSWPAPPRPFSALYMPGQLPPVRSSLSMDSKATHRKKVIDTSSNCDIGDA